MIRDPLQTLVHLIATEVNPHQLVLNVVAEAALLKEVRRLSLTSLDTDTVTDVRIMECCRISKIPLEFFRERLQLLARILNLVPYDQNYYEILGLDHRVGRNEIKQAYRRLSFAYHPDTNPDDPHAAEKFCNLQHAYEVLSHDQLRSRYDQNLEGHLWDEGEKGRVGAAGLVWRGKRYRTWPVVLPLVLLIGAVFMVDYSQWHIDGHLAGMGKRSGRVEPGSPTQAVNMFVNPGDDPQPVAATLVEARSGGPERPAPLGGPPEEATAEPLAAPADQSESREDRTETVGRPVISGKLPPERLSLASVNREEHLDRQIRTFISRYTSTYEARDMDAFMRLFEANAIENGRPIQELVPLYQANFKRAEKLRYRIDLGRWEARDEEVMVDGSFKLAVQFEREALMESTGTIQLTLVWRAEGFGVKRLNYSFKKSRKSTE